ncbi:MAG: universal stress protein [Ferruginibacter sp.]
MTNILVPTDFTAASLKLAESAIKQAGERSINIVLFHAFELPFSEFDLLSPDYREPACHLVNEPFRQACKQLKNDYPKQLAKIVVRCMNGNTKALFRNFAEANDIDLIFYPDGYMYFKIHKRSLDPRPFFKKCGIPMLTETPISKTPMLSNPNFVTDQQLVSA